MTSDPTPEDWGPAPVPAAPAMPAARARVASALAELGGTVTLATLARHLGGHPNATRAHLEHLVADGHVSASRLPPEGRGRPALGYALTPSGQRSLAGDPTRDAYSELVSAMAAHLADEPDAAGLARRIGREWGQRRGGRPSRANALAILTDLGFNPAEDADAFHLRSCPLLGAATAHPEVVCAIHAGLIEAASGESEVRLIPFAEPGACRVEFE
ncbi:MAG: hypothetical protein QM708_05715 [Propioniciclava sp.]|uniref:helix-turn-helix transcriptional regulator n=1 Tax=Propioniciclava sp. TaxID=2038686 RepID=UPI0039E263EB